MVRLRGAFPGFKAKCMLPIRNRLEADCLYDLDYDPTVRTYQRAGIRLSYEWDGRVWQHQPSFQVAGAAGETLVDCVAAESLDPGRLDVIRFVGQEWCRAHAWAYRLVTARDLGAGSRLQNIKLLWRFARHAVDPLRQGRVHGLLAGHPHGIPLIEVALAVSPRYPAQAYPDLLSLAFHHVVDLPVDDAPIGPGLRMYPCRGA